MLTTVDLKADEHMKMVLLETFFIPPLAGG